LLTNVFAVSAQTIATWYYWRWQIECFFKLMKKQRSITSSALLEGLGLFLTMMNALDQFSFKSLNSLLRLFGVIQLCRYLCL
jgi:IS4 transposase